MWICLNDGFISVVDKARNRKRDLLVRARRPGDLERIFGVKATTTPAGDYRYRAEVPRATVAQVIATRLAGIDYDNFKNSVPDEALHDAYSACWTVMGRLQPGGPYNWNAERRGRRGQPASLLDPYPMPKDIRLAPAGGVDSLPEVLDNRVCEGCNHDLASYELDGEALCPRCAKASLKILGAA